MRRSYDGEEGVRKVKELEPDVVLMDSSMPRLDGMEATRQIREFAPALKIIILTMHDPKQIALAAQRAGANLVAEKSAVDEQLTRAIQNLWKEGQG